MAATRLAQVCGIAVALTGAILLVGWPLGLTIAGIGTLLLSLLLLVLGITIAARARSSQPAEDRTAEFQRASDALARQAERLRIVHEIDRAIIREVNPEAIAGAVLQPIRQLLGVPRANVNIIDRKTGDVEWLAAAGRHRMRIRPGVRFAPHFIGSVDALRRGEPQVIDTGALPASAETEAMLTAGIRHYMAVPMIAGGELIGALSFGGEGRDFPPEQVAIAQEVATQLAVAITQAQLLQRVQRDAQELAKQAERLRIVHEIDRAIIAEARPDAIAAAVIKPLRELLGVPRAIVNLFDLAVGEVEWLAAAGRRRERSGPGVRYSIRLMGDLEVLQRGEPQIIDTEALPRGPEVDALLASGVRHYMVVPMIAAGNVIGALSFGGEVREFPDEQVAIAKEVATQLAIAIAHAHLFERVRQHASELEQRVRERTTELEAANRELESFSYSVSHDLRAPLRAVDGYSQMLQEDYAERLDDEGRRLLRVVRDGAAGMGRLIDDLLRFAQLGRKPLSQAPVDMRALAGEVATEIGAQYPRSRVELGALPGAMGDRAMLRQVWSNLIGNALKYSAHGTSPCIEVGGRAEDGECVYSVRDNGAGFDMRYYTKLFKVFQRLHRQEEFEGTGVGLAIVQRVVERHGGRVWGESAPGEGACFRFALPQNGVSNGRPGENRDSAGRG
jgi:signal transduction histidine kinase